MPPAIRGLLGEPINLDTLGGFVSWRVGNFLPVMLGLWPVLALSGTLAGEAAKGSLDLLASTPHARRTIALEKLAGHVTAVVFAMAILAVAIFVLGLAAFARLPGDEISFSAAVGQAATLYGVMMLAAGGAAFAASPWLGRTRGLGVGLLRPLRQLPHLRLLNALADHRGAQAAVVLRLDRRPPPDRRSHRLAVGGRCWAPWTLCSSRSVCSRSTRRDLGVSANVGWLRLPSLPAGTRGPFSRQLADRFGIALAWGIGIWAYAILIVASADVFGKMISSVPTLSAVIEAVYPGLDLTQPSGAAPTHLLQFRVVHPRSGRGVVPPGLGWR